MAVSTIQAKGIIQRSVGVSVSVGGSGTGNTNIYPVINNDCPAGYKPIGISGLTTNNPNIIPVAFRYVDGAYSLQLRNLSSSATTASVAVYYLAQPN